MRAMRTGCDLKKLINDLLALDLHACDLENGSMIDENDIAILRVTTGFAIQALQ